MQYNDKLYELTGVLRLTAGAELLSSRGLTDIFLSW